jgi:predicted Zn-dependent protease
VRATSIIVGIVGAALIAWFAIGVRQAHDLSGATAIAASGTIDRSQADRATQLLNSAGFLNPDRQVSMVRAQIDTDRGRLRSARHEYLSIVHAEPQNSVAWYRLAAVAGREHDEPLARLAIRRLATLVPPVSGS